MRVYIVRHGKAEDYPSEAISPGSTDLLAREPDFRRHLTGRGEAQGRFLAERLSQTESPPELILSSRYPRALNTAKSIQQAVNCPLRCEAGLEVDHPVEEALELIEREHRDGIRNLMLVGHNPQLGELIAVLASGLSPQQMILKTGELVALEFRSGKMIGGSKIIGRLRQCPDAKDESIVDGVFLTAH